MTREIYDMRLMAYKRSGASVQVKEEAIARLDAEFYSDRGHKTRQLLETILISQAEIKMEEYAS